MMTKKINVLLIEDDYLDQEMIRYFLKKKNDRIEYKLCISTDLSAGIGNIENGYPDVVLLDIKLPDNDDLSALEKIKKTNPAVPVVIISGIEDESVRLEAIKKGAQDYLYKGDMDEKLLKKAIQYSIERNKLLLENEKSKQKLEKNTGKLVESYKEIKSLLNDTKNLKDFIEAADDQFVLTDEHLKIRFANASLCHKQHTTPEKLQGEQLLDVFPEFEIHEVQQAIGKVLSEGQQYQAELKINSNEKNSWIKLKAYRAGKGIGIIINNISRNKKLELIKSAYYNIASKITGQFVDIKTLSKYIHQEIKTIIPAENFYIAIYGKADDSIFFPYVVDGKMPNKRSLAEMKCGNGLTEYIIKRGAPLLINQNNIESFINKEKIIPRGEVPKSWLGVPLRNKKRTIGALAVQSYNNANAYSEDDLNLLEFVSGQLGALIEKQQIQATLLKSEQYHRSLTENSSDITIILNKKGIVNYASKSVERIFGYKEKDVVGKSVFSFIDENDQKAIAKKFKQLMNNRKEVDCCRFYQGKKYWKEFNIKHKNQSVVTVEALGNDLLFNKAVNGIIINAHNITERKNAEVLLKEKNRELNTFIYKASHDIKGPLASISGVCNAAKKHVTAEEASTYFNYISESATRLDHILGDLLQICKTSQSILNHKEINIQKMLLEIIESLKYSDQSANVKFETVFNQTNSISSDRDALSSVFQNLIDNAIKYKNPKKALARVKIAVEDCGAGISVSVEDNGSGIPDNLKDNIFDMFFRGHENSKGTGLGLYIVKKTVEKLNGEIKVRSVLNKGTKFTVKLL